MQTMMKALKQDIHFDHDEIVPVKRRKSICFGISSTNASNDMDMNERLTTSFDNLLHAMTSGSHIHTAEAEAIC